MSVSEILPNISHRFQWVWYRNIIVWTKFYKSSIVANVVEPLIFLLALGFGFTPLIRNVNGMSYLQFIAPGLIVYAATNAATFECTYGAYARMTLQKTYDAIISTPVEIDEVVVGEVLYGTTKALFSSILVTFILALFRLIPSTTALLLPIVIFLTGFVFASMAMLFTSFTRSWDFFSYYLTLFIGPLYFLSGIMFPISTMPKWIQDIASFTPLYHSVEFSRGLIMGRLKWSMVEDAAWLLVFGVLTFMCAVVRIRKRMVV
ncbi:MAG: ABC transporter permease [Candidatus Dadabacteria bacterium]